VSRGFRIGASFAMLVALLWALPSQAQEISADAAMSALLREAAREAASHIEASAVVLEILPDHAPVLVTQIFAEELQQRGLAVRTTSADGADLLRLDIREMRFSTVPGLKSSYLRTTTAVVGALVSNTTDGVHRWSKEFTLSRSDTLRLEPARSDRDWLEDGPGFWSSVFEPTLVVLTGVVILVLLFTVRGSS